ncbi:MAG: hypothetical protein JW734_04765 [Candidatus Omnitrophica bacterium]|nr:hypothetical protein [Candidatus Omnitrophota bacterium]
MNYGKILTFLAFIVICFTGYAQEKDSLDILFFHSQHCKACMTIKEEFLPNLKEKYKDKINIIYLDTHNEDNLNKLIAIGSMYDKEKPLIPTMFFADNLIVGRDEIIAKADLLIYRCLSKNLPSVKEAASERNFVEEKFKAFSVLTIIGAGLLDGINPCAFAVIVFFMSFLACYKYEKRDVVIIGLCYVLAVFVAYLLIGLGLFKFLYSMRYFYMAMKIFYLSIAIFCFCLSLFSLYDYMRFRKSGNPSESLLQLPKFIKLKIHKVIGDEFRERKQVRRKVFSLIIGALSVGLAVSVLEAVCTGQVYLPIITFVLRSPYLRIRALLYLILYNLMFIIPLIVVFLFALWGVSSPEFSAFLKKKFGFIRICMAVLFAALGVFLLLGL